MIVFGKQVCTTILKRHPDLIKEFILAKDIDRKDFAKIKELGKPIRKVDLKKAQALAKGGNHQGWLCEVRPYRYSDLAELKDSSFLVVLAGLTDVGNIGSIIRTSYSLGVDGIVITGIKHAKSEALIRTSSGAMFDLPVAIAPNLLDVLNELKQKGFFIYGASMDGEPIDSIKVQKKRVLVLGSEGEGIVKRAFRHIDKRVAVKMKRDFDSLNVSAAAAILIYRISNV